MNERVKSLHSFTMLAAFANEDEGTAEAGAAHVKEAMGNVSAGYKGAIPDHRLAKAAKKILEPLGFDGSNTLVTTSLCNDEVCRYLEDEFRSIYGANYTMGGVAGFPFGGATAFGAMCHNIPHDPEPGNCLIVYGRKSLAIVGWCILVFLFGWVFDSIDLLFSLSLVL
jgi:hypothetical protein